MQSFKGKTFFLFSECKHAKGIIRGILCDFKNKQYYIVPNSMIDFIELCKEAPLDEMHSYLSELDLEVAFEYVNFLTANHIGFVADFEQRARFITKDIVNGNEYSIENAIIDISSITITHCHKLLKELEHLSCSFVQIRIFPETPFPEIVNMLEKFDQQSTISIEIAVNETFPLDFNFWKSILYTKPNISRILLFSCSCTCTNITDHTVLKYLICTSEKFIDERCCGRISKDFFSVEKRTYFDNLSGNSCLKNKVSVDSSGNIKNCPSLNSSYGNIFETSISECATSENFRSLWSLKKDEINICKNCEFRLICTDCRAYLQDPTDIKSKPLKCGYDPSTGKWENWATNPLSQTAISYYNLQKI